MKKNNVINLIKTISRNISILDIGARHGIGYPWNELNNDFCDLILVEPDPEEAKLILSQLDLTKKSFVVASAFWDCKKSMTLNLNLSPGTSSIFSSNFNFLNQFSDSSRFKLDKKIVVECNTIDDLIKNKLLPDFDFAKIDIQGGELAVLYGGENYLKSNAVGIEIEVEFAKMYVNQPLFSEIDIYVTNTLGLELWDLSKAHWKYLNDFKSGPSKGRLIFGNALYLRPLEGLDIWLSNFSVNQGKDKLLMLISTSLAYGFLDYAYAILNNTSISKYINKEDRDEIVINIKSISKGFRPFKNGNNFIFNVFYALANSFRPSMNGRTSEGILGSRKKGPFWL